MSYYEALEAAGAKVFEFKEFGSYQGDWWAFVEYEGVIGWITGSYGSCSGCDAFEGEFWGGYENCDKHRWERDPDILSECHNCQSANAEYNKKLADFGRSYLSDMFTNENAITEASRYIEWDSDAVEMVAWIKAISEAN